jgi:arylsulfatase A-like enzyme
MHGPGVRPGLTLDEASILDLAPTVLHYMGLDVPDHMDGQVLSRAFLDNFNHANPINNSAGTLGGVGDDAIYTADEEEAVMAKLRDMGYVA